MPKKYIHELAQWPHFTWDQSTLAIQLAALRHRQGRLSGKMEELGIPLRAQAVLQSLTEDVLKSSEIEGEMLDRQQVRSSVARRLGMEKAALAPADAQVEGVVKMMLDATQEFNAELTQSRLFSWHRSLLSGPSAGAWRDDLKGPMQVVSGPLGRERVHFETPAAARLDSEMKAFLRWFNQDQSIDAVMKAALSHLWFVTIHPFHDGNGRIARATSDMMLARSENSPRRFYSMSSQIHIERKAYYEILESTQKGGLDISPWLHWFLACLDRAFDGAETILAAVLKKSRFWEKHRGEPFNERQTKMINRLLDGFEGKLSSSKWAALGKCSQDTASRDIDDLIKRKILSKDSAGGRSTSYSLVETTP